jgi:broad specificity phosphatase PhoE
MSKLIYVIRHAETDWNVLRKLQGQSDVPLNQNGMAQAEKLKEKISHLNFDHIFSSDLTRAKQTAKILFPKHNIKERKELREVFLGQYEGMTKEDIFKFESEQFWNQWLSPDPRFLKFRFPNGESKEETLYRVLGCLKNEVTTHASQNVAFVSHGFAMRVLVHHLRPELSEPYFVANCGILILEEPRQGELKFQDYINPMG